MIKKILRKTIILFITIVFKPIVINKHNLEINSENPYLIVSNHVSFIDAIVIASVFKENVRFVAHKKYFAYKFCKFFFDINQTIPIERKRESVEKAFCEINKAFNENSIVCIFPEGQLTETGSMMAFRAGVNDIIKRNNDLIIIPLGLSGFYNTPYSRKYNFPIRLIKGKYFPRLYVNVGDHISVKNGNVNNSYLQKIVKSLIFDIDKN